jgi:DNA-binding LytR/AlgR family response regulator
VARMAENSAYGQRAGRPRPGEHPEDEIGRDKAQDKGPVASKTHPRLRVMVLEDEPLAAMALDDMLVDLGFITLGPFMELDDATDFVRDHAAEIDVAILDVNIHGDLSFDLAALLHQRNIPFFFCSGYSKEAFDPRWRRWPNLGKQYTEARLTAMIEETCGVRA